MRGLRVKNPGELSFGLFLVAAGLFAWWLSSELRFGTAMRMGPGYMPIVLSWITIGFGVVLAARSLALEGPPLGAWPWRPTICVGAAIGAFLSLEAVGLVAAVALVAILAGFGERAMRWRESLMLAAFLAAFSALVFVVGLGLPMPLWPRLAAG